MPTASAEGISVNSEGSDAASVDPHSCHGAPRFALPQTVLPKRGVACCLDGQRLPRVARTDNANACCLDGQRFLPTETTCVARHDNRKGRCLGRQQPLPTVTTVAYMDNPQVEVEVTLHRRASPPYLIGASLRCTSVIDGNADFTKLPASQV